MSKHQLAYGGSGFWRKMEEKNVLHLSANLVAKGYFISVKTLKQGFLNISVRLFTAEIQHLCNDDAMILGLSFYYKSKLVLPMLWMGGGLEMQHAMISLFFRLIQNSLDI